MLMPFKWVISFLLFLLLYVFFSQLLKAAVGRSPVRRSGWLAGAWRWRGGRRTGKASVLRAGSRGGFALKELLYNAEVEMSPAGFAVLSAILGAAGMAAGSMVFGSAKGTLVLGIILAALPSLWLRSRLAGRRLKRRKELLPSLEVVYQDYVLLPARNIRVALRKTVESGRLPSQTQTVFERLHAGLSVHWDQEEALRLFADSFGNRWADLLAALLRTALEDGTDISGGLRELIGDMRRAVRSDHAERNRLLEIRMANFSPLLFLAVFLGVNFRMDPDLAYRYYVQSEAGKEMLLDAFVLILLSFMMGIYLSLRKE